ncbi:lipase 1 [Thozetella sp. PMI_491]|nr:lipase 1 [Thozetella sp. PMI_491]
MGSLLQLLLAAASIWSLSVASPCISKRTALVAPSQDPWYTAPDGYEDTEPGTVLRLRSFDEDLTTLMPDAAQIWNILYRTTDSRYQPTFAVTTLLVPKTPDSTSLLSYQIAYDSADVDSSPSRTMYTGGFLDVALLFHQALSRGWFLNVPDFEGPLAGFTVGVMSGHAVIDPIRAVLSVSDLLGLSPDAEYATWGYSGGALASEWAGELQPGYAPEMSFAGTALGGLTPKVSSTLMALTGSFLAGIAPPGIIGIANQFPDVTSMNLAETQLAFQNQDLNQYFVNGLADIVNSTLAGVISSDGLMGYHGVPEMPVYVYGAIHDEVGPVADTDKLVDQYCSAGANILYQRNTVGGHLLIGIAAVLGGVYNTNYPAVGCTIQNVTISISNSPI